MQPVDLTALPLDWTLARQRLERDVRDDFFPDPLRYRDLFLAARSSLESVLLCDDYRPEVAESWDVPKANFSLRHCINISAVDRLVYQALVDHLAPICDPKFSNRSYAFRLRVPPAAEMYKSFVEQKVAFDDAVRCRLQASKSAVVVTLDIAQYFENISFDKLKSKLVDLTGAKVGHPTRLIIDVLVSCLTHWSPYRSVGLPQNMFPSSFLGNVFLHSLDETMLRAGHDYHRYMDDVRVVSADEAGAREALKLAITHLRDLELSINGKKTGIARPGSPEWAELAKPADAELKEIEELVRRANEGDIPNCVTRLNRMLVDIVDAGRPDRRLRFCLGRLTSIRRMRTLSADEPEGYGAKLLLLLPWQPEETTYICEYFHSGKCAGSAADTLASLLTAQPACVYGWQNYHLWCLAAEKIPGTATLVQRARQLLAEPREAPEAAGAALFLGSSGELADTDLLGSALRDRKHSISVRRALCVATQQVLESQSFAALTGPMGSSATLAVLLNYLSKLPKPKYIARARRVPLRRLADEMPDSFS